MESRVEDLSQQLKAEKQERRRLDTKLPHLEDEHAELKSEKGAVEKVGDDIIVMSCSVTPWSVVMPIVVMSSE